MNTILFIIPGLIHNLPKSWESKISLSPLSPLYDKFLRSSTLQKTNHTKIQDALGDYLQLPEDIAWARCGLDASGIKVRSNHWFKISLLTHTGITTVRGHMIQKMAEDFASEFSFAEDSIITANGDWFIPMKGHTEVVSTPVWKVTPELRTSDTFGLSGSDAEYWQTEFAKAREWLKAYSYNRLRLRQKYEPIVDFWPWGNGNSYEFKKELEYSAIFSDSCIVRGIGKSSGMSFFPLRNATADLRQMVHNHPKICAVDERLISKISDNDLLGWLETRDQIASMLLQPAMDAVDQGLISNIILDTVNGEKFIYNKKFKFVLMRPKFTYKYLP